MTKRLDPQVKTARAAARKEARAALRVAHREWWADIRADDRCTYAVMMDDGSERVLSPNPEPGAAIIRKDGLPFGEFVEWCVTNGIACSEEPGMPSRYRWRASAVKAEPVDDHQRFMIRLRWH